MSIYEWDASLRVGVKRFDNEHKRLIDLINELSQMISKGTTKEDIVQVLLELINYADTHFKHEELIMRDNLYPRYFLHKYEHDTFVDKVLVFYQELQDASDNFDTLAVQIVSFLNSWVRMHIKHADMDYGDHLNGNGVF